ncbi:DsbA family protein [Hoeflea sp. CAU 1731]
MTKRFATLLFAGVASICVVLPSQALDDSEKEELGSFIREYLIANPEILFEVQKAYEAKQEVLQKEKSRDIIANASETIFNSPNNVILGNPEGEITIVEFFDYNCGYCKRALKDMEDILANNSDVRFVLKEFPILGDDSVAAHRVASALHIVAPEHYAEFHRSLLGGHGRANEEAAMEIALSLGVDEAALKAAMDDPSIEKGYRETFQLADMLGISGTPSYVVGDETVFGAVGVQQLASKIENVRNCDSATC